MATLAATPHAVGSGGSPSAARQVFSGYAPHPAAWDELFDRTGRPHAHCAPLVDRLGGLLLPEFQNRRASADLAFVNQGVTFSVYSDRRGVEKIFPFDLIPRHRSPPSSGSHIEAGARPAASRALNLFLKDIYHEQRILKEKRDPGRTSCYGRPNSSAGRCSACECRRASIYIHICGTDLIRGAKDGHLPGARGQRADAQRRERTSSKIGQVMKRVFPAPVRRRTACAGDRGLPVQPAAGGALGHSAPPHVADRPTGRHAADPGRRTTRPTSSTASSPGRWASNWCEGRDLLVDNRLRLHARRPAGCGGWT